MADPTATWETITPDMARSLLETSPGNRSLRDARIRREADDMRRGEFHQTGESIKIDEQGRLRDGHHRLHAVLIAGVSVRMLVIRGISEAAARACDGGAARTPADRLAMDGEVNVNATAAGLAWQLRYEAAGEAFPARSKVQLANDDVFVALSAHPGMRNAASRHHRFKLLRRLITPGLLVFCLYNTGDADAFWTALEDGRELHNGSAILLLRNRLIENSVAKARLSEEEKLALIIKAYNFYRRRQPAKALRWRAGGDKPEAFPRWEK